MDATGTRLPVLLVVLLRDGGALLLINCCTAVSGTCTNRVYITGSCILQMHVLSAVPLEAPHPTQSLPHPRNSKHIFVHLEITANFTSNSNSSCRSSSAVQHSLGIYELYCSSHQTERERERDNRLLQGAGCNARWTCRSA